MLPPGMSMAEGVDAPDLAPVPGDYA